MTNLFTSRGGLTASMALSVWLTCCIGYPGPSAAPDNPETGSGATAAMPERNAAEIASANPALASADPWYQAIDEANRAVQLTATAGTASPWNQVAGAWGTSVTLLQDVAPEDPRQVFTQRKAREYQQNLYLAQQKADAQGLPRAFPTLGSDVLDEQVSLYRAYVATLGPPDVLIVGSSRALQGVDPQVLQQALAAEGYPGLRVYNFSVNGATAQVVSFLTRRLLAPDLYPKLIIWAEGSRAFNSGRFDRTFAEILASPGYAAVARGATLSLQSVAVEPAEAPSTTIEPAAPESAAPEPAAPEETASADTEPAASTPKVDHGTVPLSPITSQGFLPVNDQFNPAVYYRSFPQVQGLYDDTYRSFRLEGVQTVSLMATTQFLQSQTIPLVFVNLPLSNDYLDEVRLGYEREFQQFLQNRASQGSFILVDLLEAWRWKSHLFADPSHINRYGAREISRLLASDRRIPWAQIAPPAEAAPAAPTPQPE